MVSYSGRANYRPGGQSRLVELRGKVLANDYVVACCAVCGDDFELGSVFAVACTDNGGEIGEVCPVCLDYPNRRKDDDNPTLGNWPARAGGRRPKASRRRAGATRRPCSPADCAACEAAAPGWDAQHEILQASMIWKMERETQPS